MKKLITIVASAALMLTCAFGQEVKPKKPTISNEEEISQPKRNIKSIEGRSMDANSDRSVQPQADHNNGKRMTFQGSLFQNGEAFNGEADLTFTIEFDSLSAWTETHEKVTVINGLYSITLGQFEPMPRGLFFFQDEREMQVEVNGTVLGRVKLYAPFETRSDRDNFVLLFDQEGIPKAEMSVWAGQGFLNVDGPDDRSNAILSGNFYGQDSSALNHGMLALYGPANDPSEPDHLRVEMSSAGDGTANGANPFMNMYAVNPNSNELERMIEMYVPNFTDSTGASTFKTGRLNFYDTDGGLGQLRNNNLLFWNPQGNLPGWFGTLGRNRGFSQLLSYDDEGNYTGGLLSGWFYDGLPHVYLEDGNESMGAHLHMPEGAGELVLNGPNWNPNFAVGPKNWENGNLPYLRMNGQDEVAFVNDNGTPDDETDDFEDFYVPDLIWMEVQKWEDGTEIGSLMLRGTDGSEFGINSHGIDAQRTKVQEYELREEFGHRTVGNWRSFDTGGQLNIGGIVNDTDTTETYGGGVSIGSKFWQGTPQNGYVHVRGPVNNDNYFGANIRFEIEAVQDQHDNTGSEFRMYSPQLDENSAATQKLTMRTISDDGQNYSAELVGEGSNSPNFAIGAKTWELDNDGSNLPYFRMNGSVEFANDNGTPENTEDDTVGVYHPDLLWMDIGKWEDGTEVGQISLRSTDGTELNISPYGVESSGNMQVGRPDQGTYTQQRNNVFRVRNDNDPFSAVFLNRFDDGHSRLQLAGFNENSEHTGTVFTGVNAGGAYNYLLSPDPSNGLRIGMYVEEDLPNFFMQGTFDVQGDILADSTGALTDTTFYRPELVTMDVSTNDQGAQLGNIRINDTNGNGIDLNPYGIENLGFISFRGPNSSNMFIGNKSWENSDLMFFSMRGTNDEDPDLIAMETSIDESDGSELGQLRLSSTNGNVVEITSVQTSFNGDSGQFANMGIGIDDGSPNTNNGGALNLGGISGTTGVRLYGEFVDGSGTSVSHMALDDNSGSYVYLWGSGSVDASGDMSAASFNQTSDKRFKKEVKSIDGALAKVQQLNGYTYYWNRTAKKAKGISDESQQIGVLAQEVEAIFPQMVKTDKEGYKSVNYSALSAVLIEAVKELNAEIAVLKAENKDLKASVKKNAALEERLAKIESLLGVKSNKSSNANNK